MKAFFCKGVGVDEISRICLVRHGETAWNAELRIQGHRDLPLNAAGLVQAQALADRLAGEPFASVYCSDLLRAQQTARPLADALELPLRVGPDLRERNFGCCEGKTQAEVAAGDAALAQALRSRHPDYVPPGGESLRQLSERITACLSRLAGEHAGRTIAVVTHGGVLDAVYRRVHGVPVERPRDFPLPNAALNWLTVQGDCWRLESWADIAHLGALPQAAFVARI